MNIFSIATNTPSTLPEGKADFLLAASVTRTCEIHGITQAGIPGMIPLTPTLDAEFISTGKVYSMPDLAETPSGVPTPALLTRAVHLLTPFSKMAILNLGLVSEAKDCEVYDFDIKASDDIMRGANIDARDIFAKGRAFGETYELQGDYLILGESTPAGTTTALASAVSLGYDLSDAFSSSFYLTPDAIKEGVINQAFNNLNVDMGPFERLSQVGDNMLIFSAGFLLEACKRFDVVLAGGTQMAAVLLIADVLAAEDEVEFEFDNIHLCTTAWVRNDESSDIAKILAELSYEVDALYSGFRFDSANIPVLHKYDEGEAKEGVGAGAAIAYAYMNGITNEQLVEEIEKLMMR